MIVSGNYGRSRSPMLVTARELSARRDLLLM